MNKIVFRLASLVLFLAGSVLLLAGDPTPIPKEKIALFLDKARIDNEIPGLQCSITNGVELWTHVSGVSNVKRQTPLTAEDRYRVGSITKTFTSMTILELIDEGRLDDWSQKHPGVTPLTLDDSLVQWLPDLIINSSTVTVRTLLNHTAGFFDFTADAVLWTMPFTFLPDMRLTPKELVRIGTFEKTRTGTPGARWDYSSTNYAILALIVEAVTGNTWEKEVEDRFLKNTELKLTDTIVPATANVIIPPPSAGGYVNYGTNGLSPLLKDELVPRIISSPTFSWGVGSMISNTKDGVRWMYSIGNGKLLSPELYKEQFTWFPITDLFGTPVTGWGMGLGVVYVTQYEDMYVNVAGHRGQIYGSDCSIQYILNKDVAIAIYANRTIKDSGNVDYQIMFKLVNEFFQQ